LIELDIKNLKGILCGYKELAQEIRRIQARIAQMPGISADIEEYFVSIVIPIGTFPYNPTESPYNNYIAMTVYTKKAKRVCESVYRFMELLKNPDILDEFIQLLQITPVPDRQETLKSVFSDPHITNPNATVDDIRLFFVKRISEASVSQENESQEQQEEKVEEGESSDLEQIEEPHQTSEAESSAALQENEDQEQHDETHDETHDEIAEEGEASNLEQIEEQHQIPEAESPAALQENEDQEQHDETHDEIVEEDEPSEESQKNKPPGSEQTEEPHQIPEAEPLAMLQKNESQEQHDETVERDEPLGLEQTEESHQTSKAGARVSLFIRFIRFFHLQFLLKCFKTSNASLDRNASPSTPKGEIASAIQRQQQEPQQQEPNDEMLIGSDMFQ
jgi:hypothetical protein